MTITVETHDGVTQRIDAADYRITNGRLQIITADPATTTESIPLDDIYTYIVTVDPHRSSAAPPTA